MKTFKTFSIIAAALVITIFSCKKEEEITIPYNCTANMMADQLSEATKTGTYSLTDPQLQITGQSGTMVDFLGTSFVDGDGNSIDGIIDIEFIDAQDNKDMLLMNTPTVTNTGQLLVSGGIFAFNPSQNGQDIYIANGSSINVTMNTNDTVNTMIIYTGSVNEDGEFVWTATQETVPPGASNFSTGNTGWVNLDYPPPPCIGTLTIDLPSGRNGNNSAVMVYFADRNSVVTAYDWDADGSFQVDGLLCDSAWVQYVVISQIEGVRSYHVSVPQGIDLANTNIFTDSYNLTSDSMKVVLCDDALRLSIQDELE